MKVIKTLITPGTIILITFASSAKHGGFCGGAW